MKTIYVECEVNYKNKRGEETRVRGYFPCKGFYMVERNEVIKLLGNGNAGERFLLVETSSENNDKVNKLLNQLIDALKCSTLENEPMKIKDLMLLK